MHDKQEVNMHGKQRKRGRLGGQGPTSGVYANKSSKNDGQFCFFCYKLGNFQGLFPSAPLPLSSVPTHNRMQ